MKKVLFFLTSEGRGHMSQAISLADILENNGFEISKVIIDTNRVIPKYFLDRFNGKIVRLIGPNFVFKKERGLSLLGTAFFNMKSIPNFFSTYKSIKNIISETKPDLIVNLFTFMGSFYKKISMDKTPMITMANQFSLTHETFKKPPRSVSKLLAIKFANKLIGLGADNILAFSFNPDFNMPREKRVKIVPPVMRKDVLNLKTSTGNYYLVYLLNKGYLQDLIEWHEKNPSYRLHCFCENEGFEKFLKYDKTLTFHSLDNKKFLNFLAHCKGLVTTGGFETFCEASYLGKPIMMIPVKNQPEQEFNAYSIEKNGRGVSSKTYNLEKLIGFTEKYQPDPKFKDWVSFGRETILKEIKEALKGK